MSQTTLRYAPGARGTIASIRNAVLAVPGVTACNMIENTVMHTITAIVLGGDTATLQQRITEMRPAGIPCELYRPLRKIVSVAATVVANKPATPEIVTRTVLDALDTFFKGLTIGTSIPYSRLSCVVSSVKEVSALTSLSITCGDIVIDQTGKTLEIGDTEIAVQGQHTITVAEQ